MEQVLPDTVAFAVLQTEVQADTEHEEDDADLRALGGDLVIGHNEPSARWVDQMLLKAGQSPAVRGIVPGVTGQFYEKGRESRSLLLP